LGKPKTAKEVAARRRETRKNREFRIQNAFTGANLVGESAAQPEINLSLSF
jgi:hypothetical protein